MLSHHHPAAGPAFEVRGEGGPLIATAVHAGHVLRPEVAAHLAVPGAERRAHEDPFTDRWALACGDVAVVAHRSRFECDLDRPRVESVYRDVWTDVPTEAVVGRSLALHDAFYGALESVVIDAVVRYGAFALLDFHAADRRRPGAEVTVAAPGVDRRWGEPVARFLDALGLHRATGRGGHLTQWVNERYGGSGFALSVTVTKTYLDDAGRLRPEAASDVEDALAVAASEVGSRLTVA